MENSDSKDNTDSITNKPLISIGLPVYNGEKYVQEAVESILNQTFTDFELIISDNASTDKTEAICRAFASRDERVSYIRHDQNFGAARNFNHVVDLARGDYFCWVAHDDIIAPEYLQVCLDALMKRNDLVMAFTHAMNIDENGQSLGYKADILHSDNMNPATRFRYSICVEHSCLAIFGLIRISVLRQTPLIAPYVGSDRVLLAELGLWGPFAEIKQRLFFHREHSERSTRAEPSLQQRATWFDPSRAGRKTFPHWKIWLEYFYSIRRVHLSVGERVICLFQTVRWLRWHYKDLWRDVAFYLSPQERSNDI